MKKNGVLLTTLIALTTISLALAQNFQGDIQEGIRSFVVEIGNTFTSFLGPILGVEAGGEFVFAKILLFFVIFSMISIALKNVDIFGSNRGAHFLVTIGVSILSIRYLPDAEIIRAILLPYGALAATFGIVAPILVIFYFVHNSDIGPFARQFVWTMYGLFYFMLYWQRIHLEEISSGIINWIYLIGLVFIIANILLDKWIHQYVGAAGTQKYLHRLEDARLGRIEAELDNLNNITDPSNRVKKNIKRLERQLARGHR